MLRKTETLSRLLLTTLVASVIGCQADSPNKTSDQIVGPLTPVGIAVSVSSNRTSLTAGSETTATITVRAIRTDTGAPVPDFTNFVITTSLGSLDAVGGGNSVTLPSRNGIVTTTLFPGDVEGTARISATVLGALGFTSVLIKPAVEVIPPPVASTLSISSDTVLISDQDSSTFIGVTATVLGSNLKPFKKAPVFFSVSPAIGVFSSSGGTVGDVRATNSAGQASDTLQVNGADLTGINSLDITATLTVEGGGTITATVTITVTHAPLASGIQLFLLPDSTVDDNGTAQSVTLQAKVTDNQTPPQPIPGILVTFATGLGSITPSSQEDTTDSAGVAQVTLNLTAAQIANYCSPTFQVTASFSGGSDSDFVTISRTPLVASFSYIATSVNDVDFTDTSTGGPDGWQWDFNNDGTIDLTTQSPQNVDLSIYGFASGNTKTVRFVVTRGICTAPKTALQSVTVP